jgi:hypothetical protein
MSQFYDTYHDVSYFIVHHKKISWRFSPRRSILILCSGNLSSPWCAVAVRQFEGLLSMSPSGRFSSVNVRTSLHGRLLEVCQKHPPSSSTQKPQIPRLSSRRRYLNFRAVKPIQTQWETRGPVSGLLNFLFSEGSYP